MKFLNFIENKNIKYPKYLLIKATRNVTHWVFWLITCNHVLKKKLNIFSVRISPSALVCFYKASNLKMYQTHLAIFQNIFLGLAEKYFSVLELRGVGYTILKKKNFLVLNLGFSHKINYKIPSFLNITLDKKNIHLNGFELQKLKNFASLIRGYKSPEPYKGKGIRYLGENISIKESKKSK